MATAAPHVPNSLGATGSAESRWSKTGESGSAFKDLNRGVRGRGFGRGRGRGGRGSRGAPRDGKPSPGVVTGGHTPNTMSTLNSTSNPASCSIVTPATSTTDKPPAPPTSKSKAASRRASRTIPPSPLPQINHPEIPSSPSASRQHNRKRRTQGKATPAALPQIHISALDDNFVRAQRNRADSAPHTASIKNVPRHLTGSSVDIRHNIDALVERVRAVAMADNRPSTPGSHIDWAGDDDDGLPDLDDWGVTPSPGLESKADLMSPIVVDGLKPLPGVEDIPPSSVPPPEPQNLEIAEPSGDRMSFSSAPSDSSSIPASEQLLNKSPNGKLSSRSSTDAPLPSPSLKTHPALSHSRKPTTSSRKSTTTSSSLSANPTPAVQPTVKQSDPIAVTEQTQSIHASAAIDSIKDGPLSPIAAVGLSASIHAPGARKSASAPVDPSARPPKQDYRTQADAAGRPIKPEHHSRPPRFGFSTPRGGPPLGVRHNRTQSTPPTGAHRNHSVQRPVLTGGALSLLAKAVGDTSHSPPKTAVAATQN